MRTRPVRTSRPVHPGWDALRRGRTLPLTTHPRALPGSWRQVIGMEPHGQAEDWVLPMPDGSRLHAHVYRDGRMSVHRDRWDPERGPLHRIAHVAFETTAGRLALGLTAARWLGWLP